MDAAVGAAAARERGRALAVDGERPARPAEALHDGLVERGDTARWQDERLDLCEAERRDGGAEDLVVRRACVEAAHARMEAVVTDLGGAEDELAARLVEATKDLERIPSCDDPRSSDDDAVADRLRAAVEQARALERAGELAAAERDRSPVGGTTPSCP